MFRYHILVALILSLAGNNTLAQTIPELGVPLIHNFTPDQYGAPGKIWELTTADNGMLYAATDQGLLVFDGQQWEVAPGSRGIVRSLIHANDSLLYSGSDRDFGQWNRHTLNYSSLNPFRENRSGVNDEFWGTYALDDAIIFASFDNIFVYRSNQLTKIAAPSRFMGSYQSGKDLYFADETNGVYRFDGYELTLTLPFPEPLAWQVVGIHQLEDRLLLVTRDQGVLQYKNGEVTTFAASLSKCLANDKVFVSTAIGQTHLAFGTILSGVYIADLAGNIVQHLNKANGLLNNTVLSMNYSPSGQLWVAMDFGLSRIDLWSDLSYVFDQRGQFGTGQTALLMGDQLYLGTNQGLYTINWRELKSDGSIADFTLLPGSSGQVWALAEVGNQLLCGHDRGLFEITPAGLRLLPGEAGVLAIAPVNEQQLLVGYYNGIGLYEKRAGRWEFVRKVIPFQGACRQLIFTDKNTLWVKLPNFGVIRATLSDELEVLEQRIFAASSFSGEHQRLVETEEGIALYTSTAAYSYQTSIDSFYMNPLPSVPVQRVQYALEGSYYPQYLNASYGFFPVHNGFALQSLAAQPYHPENIALVLRQAQAFTTDTSWQLRSGQYLPHRYNNIKIRYAVPQQAMAEYQYRLQGLTTEWSTWSAQAELTFLQLPAGTYELNVRARVGDTVSEVASLPFVIASPWYRSLWMMLVYLIGLGVIFGLNYRWKYGTLKRQKKYIGAQAEALEQQRITNRKQELLLQQKKHLEKAVDNLKQQLRSKTIELAKQSKQEQDKNRIIQDLQKEIERLSTTSAAKQLDLGKVRRLLSSIADQQDAGFDLQMEQLHQDFIERLSARFTNLTAYDLRLCTYLKTGLSTREIAGLMNVRPSSVNVSRSRLRKKLKLGPQEDLYRFLLEV